MINISVDDEQIKQIFNEKVQEKLQDYDAELVWWDAKELCRRTCMSWTSIQERLFKERGFQRYKIGNKWYFPAKETREFLLKWLKENGRLY